MKCMAVGPVYYQHNLTGQFGIPWCENFEEPQSKSEELAFEAKDKLKKKPTNLSVPSHCFSLS